MGPPKDRPAQRCLPLSHLVRRTPHALRHCTMSARSSGMLPGVARPGDSAAGHCWSRQCCRCQPAPASGARQHDNTQAADSMRSTAAAGTTRQRWSHDAAAPLLAASLWRALAQPARNHSHGAAALAQGPSSNPFLTTHPCQQTRAPQTTHRQHTEREEQPRVGGAAGGGRAPAAGAAGPRRRPQRGG
jgi:hypothetical protein